MIEDAPLLTKLGQIPDNGKAAFVTTKDAKRIRVAWWGGQPDGTVYLFPGRTEYIEKYCHMIQKLIDRKLNVVVFDWRGQGLSDREDDRQDFGYVNSFTEYQSDIQAALTIDAIADMPRPNYLFAHSMGGAIGLRAICSGILIVKAAVFSSPMWGLKHADLLRPFFTPVVMAARFRDKHKSLFPGTKPTFYAQAAEFEGNEITTDRAHWDMFKAHLDQEPRLGLGGPSLQWVAQAVKEMARLRRRRVPNIPILVFKAEDEIVVDPSAIAKRVVNLPDARLEVVAGARHEVWMETPAIQERVWSRIDAFMGDL